MNSYAKLSDSELANTAGAGDEAAFAEIVRRHSPRVFRFAGRFFRQRSLVEEAAQEVFLKIFIQLKNFEGRGSFEGWVTRITVNTCLNLLRAAKRQPELTVSDLSADETAWLDGKMFAAAGEKYLSETEKLVAADLVQRVLETVSPDDRLALTLVDVEGLSIKETAEITGWSEAKVKVQAFRARRKMREAIEKLFAAKTKPAEKTEKVRK